MKILLAAAAMSLVAGTAFAGEGNGNPFPFAMQAPPMPTAPLAYRGVPVYQNPYPFTVPHVAWNVVPPLPGTGSEAIVQTANSLPVGAADGTPAVVREQVLQAWLAGRSNSRLAATQPASSPQVATSAPAAQPHG